MQFAINLQLRHQGKKLISLHARLWFYNETYKTEISFSSLLINEASKCTFLLGVQLSKVGNKGFKLKFHNLYSNDINQMLSQSSTS